METFAWVQFPQEVGGRRLRPGDEGITFHLSFLYSPAAALLKL